MDRQVSTRPNIIFVLTDDLSWNLVRYMPHVVAMQRAGLTFSKYYVVDSLCCPSRSAIFTGEYPHDNGVFGNRPPDGGYQGFIAHNDSTKSFAIPLHDKGYRTGFMGKYLNGYTASNPVAPGWSTWDGVDHNGYREFHYKLNDDGKVESYGNAPKDYATDVLSQKAVTFVHQAAGAHTPFMLEVATFAPHKPYVPAQRYLTADAALSYPRTPTYDTKPTDPPSWFSGVKSLSSTEEGKIDGYFRQRVEADLATDEMIGALEHELDVAGIADNTYLVFSSDNGYHMGEYQFYPGKQTAFDTDINVPLIVVGPGVPAGSTSTLLTSGIDLAPTFEALTGSPIGPDVDGVDMSGLWHGQHPAQWQQGILIEHRYDAPSGGDPDAQKPNAAEPPTYEAVRTSDALYVRYTNGQQEYYDTSTDPYELHNLAGQGVPPQLASMVNALATCHRATQCQAAAR